MQRSYASLLIQKDGGIKMSSRQEKTSTPRKENGVSKERILIS